MNTTYILLVLLLICCIYTVLFARMGIEEFAPRISNKIYYNVEDTSEKPLQYIGCGMITLSAPKGSKDIFLDEKGDDPNLLTNVPFYSIKKTLRNFQEIATAILPILQKIQTNYPEQKIGPVAALVSKINTTQVQVVYLLPNFDTTGIPLTGFNAIAKAHRSYYRIVYSTFYTNSSKLCVDQKNTQCPGIPVRTVTERPSLYGQTRAFASTSQTSGGMYGGFGGYYYDPYDYWIINNYYTPCGTPKTRNYKYYAVYLVNPYDPLYDSFSIEQTPNISFISEYGGIRYGCDFQVVSPNKKYMLRLEEFFTSEPPGLVLYKILEGNPFLECRNKEPVVKEKVWKIPLSYGNYVAPPEEGKKKPIRTDFNYAHFKIENDVLYLVDKDVTVWSYQIDVSKSPAIVQLDDQGSLVIYDSKNELIDKTLTSGFMNRVANRERSSRYFIDEAYIAENERKYNEYVKREAAHNQALSQKEQRDLQTYYNKEVCPIGFVDGEL